MNNEKKRALQKMIAPAIKKLVNKYGYDAVNYTWQQEVANQRKINKLNEDIKKLEAKKKALRG